MNIKMFDENAAHRPNNCNKITDAKLPIPFCFLLNISVLCTLHDEISNYPYAHIIYTTNVYRIFFLRLGPRVRRTSPEGTPRACMLTHWIGTFIMIRSLHAQDTWWLQKKNHNILSYIYLAQIRNVALMQSFKKRTELNHQKNVNFFFGSGRP